jgi:iron complex outermembrane receptor protein
MSSFNLFIEVVSKHKIKNVKRLKKRLQQEVINMRAINKHFKYSLLCLAVSSASYGVNAAQDTDKTLSDKNNNFEIIMVTAQKRVQRIIDVPTSITAVDSKAINNSNSQQIADIQDLVPNLNIEEINSFNNAISIRGVGSSSRNISFDTRVGVYIDGVYLGQSPGLNQDLMDIERIEILRGPQGSLFGKNTVAGAINILTKKPHSEFEGKVKARVGNYNAQQFSGFVNAPLSEDIALKVSASSMIRDGFVENVHPDAKGDVGNRDSLNYRAQLLVESFEDLAITLTIDGSTANETPLFGEHSTDFLGMNYVETGGAPKRTTYNDFLATEERDISGVAAEIIYDFSDGSSFKSITAQRNTELEFLIDLDYSSLDLFKLHYDDEYDQFTQELQYTSNTGGPFEYIVGLYYYQQDSKSDRSAIPGSNIIPISDQTFLAGSLAQFGLDTFVGTDFEFLYPADVINHIGTVDTQSYAIFSNLTYDLADDIHLGIGLRLGRESKKVDWSIDGSTSGFFGLATANLVDEISDSDFLPSISLNYDVNKNMVAYARIATGSKSGGFNLDFVTDEQLDSMDFTKETSINYEIGLKGYNEDYTFRYSVALFSTNFDNYQQSQFIDIGDSRTVIAITNAATAQTDGVEIELAYDVNDNFSVGFAAGLLDATFGDNVLVGSKEQPDVSGKRLPGSAEIQSSLTLDYTSEFNEGNWFTHADISYSGDVYTTPNNVETAPLLNGDTVIFGYLPSHTAINVRLGVEFETWSASLWARNLADSDYLVSGKRQFFGGIDETWNAPRTVGIEVSYQF